MGRNSGNTPGDRDGADQGAGRDSRLVQRAVESAREGDPGGLHFLYARYAPDVFRSVTGVVHDRRKAEEITQGVFRGLATAIDGDGQPEVPFATRIRRIARSTALDHVRTDG